MRSKFAALRVANRDYWRSELHSEQGLLIEWPAAEKEPTKALVQIARGGQAEASERDFCNLPSQHRLPGCRRSLALDSESGHRELILVDAPEEFNASNGRYGRCGVLEAEHRPSSGLDASALGAHEAIASMSGQSFILLYKLVRLGMADTNGQP